MPPLSDKPALNELLHDDASRGIELALTPVVFGGLGYLLDQWLGTGPWLAAALAAFGLVGTVIKMWYGYDARMRELESSGSWSRSASPAPDAPTPARDPWSDRKAAS